MLEENKSLENRKRKIGKRMLLIGLGLCLLGPVLGLVAFFTATKQELIVIVLALFLTIVIMPIIGIIFIFVALFLTGTIKMSSTQQSKPDPKGKAITSFVLGIVSIIPVAILLMLTMGILVEFPIVWAIFFAVFMITIVISPFSFLVLLFVALIGLILGREGLNSPKRNLAIIGIVLCIISALASIWALFQDWNLNLF